MLLGLALGAWLLVMQPAGAQDRPPVPDATQPRTIDVIEGTNYVLTFRANDPDNRDVKIIWTLGGADAANFTIEGGALEFGNKPDFENPTDEDLNNTYSVTVRMGSGGEDGEPGDTNYIGDDVEEIEVTVNVRNMDEPGMVVISPLRPQVGTPLTATLSDEDQHIGTGDWQWYRAMSKNDPSPEKIEELSDKRTYIPTDDDLPNEDNPTGYYLRVTVEYVDNAGDDVKPLSEQTDHTVRKDVSTSNSRPKFPDQRTLTGGTETARGATERFIVENSPAGTPVGAPVTGFDDAEITELLTYRLSSTGTTHADSFRIDAKSGQITVSPSAGLNAEATGRPGNAETPFAVTVTATDPDGRTQTIAVTIRVVGIDEAPTIDGVYRASVGNHSIGDRVPTEMSHMESDRLTPNRMEIDTNLDIGATDTAIEGAVYTASDPEDTDPDTLTWSLDGADAYRLVAARKVKVFTIDADSDAIGIQDSGGAFATLAFATGPDFEKPWNRNTDQVYDVTIVVTDSVGNTDELPVTVKVINSTKDNKPGKVMLSNRVPEVNVKLTATVTDPDEHKAPIKWQWYRAPVDSTTTYPSPCGDATSIPTDVNRRAFIVDTIPAGSAFEDWVKIGGATSREYTPKSVLNEVGDAQASDSDLNKCLRATVTYKDGPAKFDPTVQNDPDTGVDESLEGTWVGTQYPVKAEDTNNQEPVFTDNGSALHNADTPGQRVSEYQVTRAEGLLDTTTALVGEVFSASDIATHPTDLDKVEDDGTTNDILTYSLGGTDAEHFVILGSDEYPTAYDPDGGAAPSTATTITGGAGTLIFKLSATGVRTLDYETKSRYEVTVFATDPSGDGRGRTSVKVTINVSDVNEGPTWKTTTKEPVKYEENRTDPVFTFKAEDLDKDSPDTGIRAAGITYDLATVENVGDVDVDADNDLFKISTTGGVLSFRSPPNYEDPKDMGTDNQYQVTVRATAADSDSTATPPTFTIPQTVTVIVTNVNEAPVFPETPNELDIAENADDLQKEPRGDGPDRYLVNRGVGEPNGIAPTAPNLDVGIPIVAKDDDSTSTFAIPDTATDVDRIDGLTYKLDGTADALAAFDIVPATGQILTLKKLNHEIKGSYNVKVTATDPSGEDDSIDLTINVTNVEEQPIPVTVQITGASSHSHEENSEEALGDYTAYVTGTDHTPTLSLDGPDADQFMLGRTETLKFKAAPDYENPRGQQKSDDNTNTYTVIVNGTVKDNNGNDVTGMITVTVKVTDVDELGTLEGMPSISYAEDRNDAVGEYTVSGANEAMATWTREGADASHFMLDGSGASRMLKFSSSPNFEAPADANTDNIYMVTVKASYGGETEMVAVTVTVTDVVETLPATVQDYDKNIDGNISRSELFDAVDDYFAGEITRKVLFDVIDAYFR